MNRINRIKRSLTDAEKKRVSKERKKALAELQTYLPEPTGFFSQMVDRFSDKNRMRTIWQSHVNLYDRLLRDELTVESIKVTPSDCVQIESVSDEGATLFFQCDDVVLGVTGQVFEKRGFPSTDFEILLDSKGEVLDLTVCSKKMKISRILTASEAKHINFPRQIIEFKGSLNTLEHDFPFH
jgi:hypothetical protein